MNFFSKIKNFILHLIQKILKILKNNIVNVILILIGLVTLFVANNGVNLQKESIKKEEIPFFKYSFDNNKKSFQVDGGEKIDIIKADWFLVGKWLFEEDKYSLRKINNLDKELSWYDIRDAYGQTLVNTLQDWGKDVIECEFFRLTPDAIPVMVSVIYDTKDKTRLESRDLLLITRIDTERPNAQVKLRNVEEDEIIDKFFNENLWQVKSATEHILENYEYSNEDYSGNLRTYTGKCGVIMDQPIEGY
jgi:hypothetical protein